MDCLNDEIRNLLQIRYVKLHFTIQFTGEGEVPRSKTSALRGGMGEMLLRANCIRDRKCEECDFLDECIVQRTMYSRFDEKPDYISKGDSVGYVVECEDYRDRVEYGDEIKFNLILFGKTIVYFNQYMTAIYSMGQNGLGNSGVTFAVKEVTNSLGEPILKDGNIYMKRFKVMQLSDYVEHRMLSLSKAPEAIQFKTAASLKYNGRIIEEFNGEAIVRSLLRRIYMLNCFEGNKCDEMYTGQYSLQVISQEAIPVTMSRYSNRQNVGMSLKGIKGTVRLLEIAPELLPLLLAGELIHIGKNTSFGFGRYTLI